MPKNHTNIGSRSTKKSTDCCKSAVCFDLANTMYSGKYNYTEWECCVIFVIKDDELQLDLLIILKNHFSVE